jgi:hypothetical protein
VVSGSLENATFEEFVFLFENKITKKGFSSMFVDFLEALADLEEFSVQHKNKFFLRQKQKIKISK